MMSFDIELSFDLYYLESNTMPANYFPALFLLLFMPSLSVATEESITVTVVGTLRTGILAIGGETTGTTITAKGITWELDFGKNARFRKASETLNGKKVVVQGSLKRVEGVEIKERWIVTVTGFKPHGKIDRKNKDAADKPGGFCGRRQSNYFQLIYTCQL